MLYGLYAITDQQLTPAATLLTQVAQAIAGGVRILQLRDKTQTDAQLLPLALELKALCRAHQVIFIMNDRLELAERIAADGVHLGRDDVSLREARARLPGKLIGVSCYGNIATAQQYAAEGADYVAFGACFASPTKPHAPVIAPTLIQSAKQQLAVPVCAIGGITASNAPILIAQGADMLAVISDLWCAADITKQTQRLSRLFPAR